jgi:hypothetical protein
MNRAILIPFGASEKQADRKRNLDAVLRWYEPLAIPVTLGCVLNKDGSFNRSASRNAAADGAGDWDVAMFSDADCIAEHAVVLEAFRLAEETGKLILPHDEFWRVSERSTPKIVGKLPTTLSKQLALKLSGETRVKQSMMPSGALVMTREAFETIGRYDEGFKHWGYEDNAFLADARATVGVIRLPGMLWHLWHPRETGTFVQRASEREHGRIRRARKNGTMDRT